MTVSELIKELQKQPQNKEVLIRGHGNGTLGSANIVREGRHAASKGCICIVTY